MAARFFFLTDKLSSLLGLAMVVRPFFITGTPKTGFFRTECIFFNHISMTRRRTVLQLFFMNISLLNTSLVLQFDGSFFSIFVVKWCYSFLYIYHFTINRISSGYDWRFFFLPFLLFFSPILGALKFREKEWQNLGPNILGQSLDQKNLWGCSLWLIYHDTTGWWLPLSNGLSFSILWHMNNWLGMSTISTRQISEMKPTISFKICCYFPMDHLCSLRNQHHLFQHQVLWFAKVGKPFGFGRVWVWVH